ALAGLDEAAWAEGAVQHTLNAGCVLRLFCDKRVGQRLPRTRRERIGLRVWRVNWSSVPRLRLVRRRRMVRAALAALRIPSLDIFRHRQFAQFWAGRMFATMAVQIQSTAMGWQVYDAARAHGQTIAEAAFVLGLVGLAQFLPLLVLSLFGGQAADRYDRRLILTICIVAKALIVLALALVSNMGPDVIIPAVFAAAASAGIINAFMPPAASALLPMLLPREELPPGIAWSSLAFQFSLIVGPAVGGLLYGAGPAVPYFTALVLAAFSALLMFTLRPPAQEPVRDARTIGMIVEGL